jgi:hypothetical protein
MKSPDPLDPTRLSVNSVDVGSNAFADDHSIRIHVTFTYAPWFDEDGQDTLWEQANALTCLREALKRGGVGAEE